MLFYYIKYGIIYETYGTVGVQRVRLLQIRVSGHVHVYLGYWSQFIEHINDGNKQ